MRSTIVQTDVARPEGTGKKKTVKALFGFQLIAVFNQGFDDKLTAPEQQLHYTAM